MEEEECDWVQKDKRADSLRQRGRGAVVIIGLCMTEDMGSQKGAVGMSEEDESFTAEIVYM